MLQRATHSSCNSCFCRQYHQLLSLQVLLVRWLVSCLHLWSWFLMYCCSRSRIPAGCIQLELLVSVSLVTDVLDGHLVCFELHWCYSHPIRCQHHVGWWLVVGVVVITCCCCIGKLPPSWTFVICDCDRLQHSVGVHLCMLWHCR